MYVVLSHGRDGRAYLHDELSDQSCSLPGFDCKLLEFATRDSVSAKGCCCVVLLAQDGATYTVIMRYDFRNFSNLLCMYICIHMYIHT